MRRLNDRLVRRCYFILTAYVPLLLITHGLCFEYCCKRRLLPRRLCRSLGCRRIQLVDSNAAPQPSFPAATLPAESITSRFTGVF